jgi:drug/metabolite transporter (DMT)-like permease
MSSLSDHMKGVLLTTGGFLVISPDALIIRLISVDSWTLMFWRGLLTAVGLSVLMTIRYGSSVFGRFRAIGRRGALATVMFTISSICFVTAITHTTAANALVILSVSPLFAAGFSLVFLRERVALRTWLAIAAAICGIAIIFLPSLGGAPVAGQGLVGDLAALGTAIAIAGYFTILRQAREVDMAPSLAFSGLLTATVVFGLASPLAVTVPDIGYLALLGLIISPLSFAMISAGPRYISAPEVGLLMPTETVLGPLWVWLVLAESPGAYAIAGGAVVIGALVIHSLAALRVERAAA